MEVNTILLYINLSVLFFNILIASFNLYMNKELRKEKSIAYILDPKTNKVKYEVNITKKGNKTFRHKKNTYNIMLGNGVSRGKETRYYYVEGRSDAINLFEKEHSRISSDVLDALLNENMTKKLNDYVSGLPFDLEAKHVIIFVGVLIGLGVFFFG